MLNWFLSSAVLIGIVLLLRCILKKRLDPRLTYALWLLCALRVLVSVSLFSAPVSVAGFAEQAGVAESVETIRQAVTPKQTFTGSLPQDSGVTLEEYAESWKNSGLHVYEVAPFTEEELTEIRKENPAFYRDTTNQPIKMTVERLIGQRTFWAWVYRVGCFAVFFTLLICNLRFDRKLKKSRRPYDKPLPVPCKLPVYVVDPLPSPCLFGLFRPAVYLNRTAVESGRLEHILTHELTHFRHLDHWWALVRCACLTVQWFNPLVWVAAHLSRQDCETACDASVIRVLGEAERLDYGRTLVGMIVAGQRRPAALLETATTMTGGVKSIRERVTLIAKKPRMTAVTLGFVVLIAALAVGCTFGSGKNDPNPLDTYLGDTYVMAGGQSSDLVGPIMLSYAPTKGSIGTVTISEDFFGCADETGLDWGDNITDPVYKKIRFDQDTYGQSDLSYPTLEEFFGQYDSITAYEITNAAKPLHLLILDEELWMAINVGAGNCYILRLERAENPEKFSALYQALLSESCTDQDCAAFVQAVLTEQSCADAFSAYTAFARYDSDGKPITARLAPYLAAAGDCGTLQQLLLLMDASSAIEFARSYADNVGGGLDAMNAYFSTPGINGFLHSLYGEALETDLFEAFYIGYGHSVADDDAPCPRYMLSADEISKVLQLRLGLYADKGWLIANFPWEYDPDTDAFYHQHGDTNFLNTVCYHLTEQDGVYIAYCYVEILGLTTVQMIAAEDGGYQFLSHAMTFREPTAAELAESVYQAIVGDYNSRDFYLTVDDSEYGERCIHITEQNGYNLPSSLSFYRWNETEPNATCECAVTATITLSTPDGSTEMICYQESCGTVLVTADGITYRLLAETDGRSSLFSSLLQAADSALVAGLDDDIVIDGGIDDYTEVVAQFARQYAANIAALPGWAPSAPVEVIYRDSGVSSAYFGEGTENFNSYYSLYFSPEMGNSDWQAGSGMEQVTEGEYAGWWIWGIGADFARNEDGNWVCTGQYTGGEGLTYPTPLARASMEKLVYYFAHTIGSDHEYLIPYYICQQPASQLDELETALLAAPDKQALCTALGRFLKDYGSHSDIQLTYEVLSGSLPKELADPLAEGYSA